MLITDSAERRRATGKNRSPDDNWRRHPPGSLEGTAGEIFGEGHDSAHQKWVRYWSASTERNRKLLQDFERLALIDLEGKTVLDVGCGTGGLGPIVRERGAEYVGGDYHRHVLQFAEPGEGQSFVELSALSLPFPDSSVDLIVCFDMVEHLVGGYDWQRRFLCDARRVLRRTGFLLLTTPNFWYPYDAHTELRGPQFLPSILADAYVKLCNPAFLKEHRTFREIRLMRPAELRRSVAEAGLAPLHELPCGLDSDEYRRLHPWLGLLTRLGLGWLPHAEFWTILTHADQHERLRHKLRRNWHYVRSQPGLWPIERFSDQIDFDQHPHGHQLLDGWHWYERDERGFRWTTDRARVVMETRREVSSVRISGFTPLKNRIEVHVDGVRVGERCLQAGEPFAVDYLLPFPDTACRLFEIEIRCRSTAAGDAGDTRELGLMIFSVELTQ